MADDSLISEIVTRFFLDTCQPNQQLNQLNGNSIRGLPFCVELATPLDHSEINIVPLTTGSAAELYIVPMFSCVGDVDVMYYNNRQLAIQAGTAPPTQLQAEFQSHVDVCEITDSEFPGYVYLVWSYKLTECIDDGKYGAEQCQKRYASFFIANAAVAACVGDTLRGPAVASQYSRDYEQPGDFRRIAGLVYSRDLVSCIRCLSWPSQAADWPSRYRGYGWPDSATVHCIVSSGCDVVNVAHKMCKQDEWMGKCQWRLSFSRAEIVLLNSWVPVQQIVYHMLRVFVKRLTENNADVYALSNYHMKTLMLWSCELKPRSWWTDDLNVVRICVELLHIMAVWLSGASCPNYFITNCNLLGYNDNLYSTQCIARNLISITEPWLAEWFINHYVQECAQSCPECVSRLFNDVSTIAKLQKAVSAVAQWKVLLSPVVRYSDFEGALSIIVRLVSCESITSMLDASISTDSPTSARLLYCNHFFTRRM